MTLTKMKAYRNVWGFLLKTYPQSLSCNTHEAIGGTVYIIKLKKDDLIDGELHQECSLKNVCKGRIESRPVTFLFLGFSI